MAASRSRGPPVPVRQASPAHHRASGVSAPGRAPHPLAAFRLCLFAVFFQQLRADDRLGPRVARVRRPAQLAAGAVTVTARAGVHLPPVPPHPSEPVRLPLDAPSPQDLAGAHDGASRLGGALQREVLRQILHAPDPLVAGLHHVQVRRLLRRGDDRRELVVAGELVGHQQPAGAPVPVLEGVDLHVAVVQPCGAHLRRQRLRLELLVHLEEPVHFRTHLLGRAVFVDEPVLAARVVGPELVLPAQQIDLHPPPLSVDPRRARLVPGEQVVHLLQAGMSEGPLAAHQRKGHLQCGLLVRQQPLQGLVFQNAFDRMGALARTPVLPR